MLKSILIGLAIAAATFFVLPALIEWCMVMYYYFTESHEDRCIRKEREREEKHENDM